MKRRLPWSPLAARGALLLAVALLLTSGAVALAAKSPKDEKVRLVPADQARARSANLRLADFPAFWTAQKGEPSTPLRCPGVFDPDFSRVTITATEDSPAFSRGVQFAGSVVEVYATKAQLATEWRLGTSPAAVRCARLEIEDALSEPGVKTRVTSVTTLSVPRVAPRQAAWRVRVRLTEASSGETLDFVFDEVDLARDRALAIVVFGHLARDRLSPALEARLVRRTGARLARAFP